MEGVEKVYPTKADDQGFYFEDRANEEIGIETKVDADDNVTKRVTLSGGKTAVLRELTTVEARKARKIAGDKEELAMPAFIALCAQVWDKDGKEIKFVAEDLDNWKAKDTNRLITACSQLNF